MDIVIPKKALLKLLTRCAGVAQPKSAMPALANVLLTARGDTLTVAATDLYLSISGEAPAEIAKPGSVAAPAKDLLERVKAMPEGPVQIMANDAAQVTAKAVGSPRRFTLHGMPGGEFPVLDKPRPEMPARTLPASVLSLLLNRTHFSVSTDETRPHVNSLLVEWEGDQLRAVSTDGHRLTKMDVTVPGATGAAKMLVPLRAVNELRKLADEALASEKDATITLTLSGPSAFFSVAGMQFSTKLVDAQFPPYAQVIPNDVTSKARVPRAPFADALRAVSLAAAEKTGGVKVSFSLGKLLITTESAETGSGFDELPIDYTGPEITIGFNAKYVLDALGAIEDEEVLLGVSGELDPGTLRPAVAASGHDFVAVLMPMRI